MFYLMTGEGADKIIAPDVAVGFPKLNEAEKQILTNLGWTAIQIQEFEIETCV